jgi:predicted NBD/HSP70 family sugar kinase
VGGFNQNVILSLIRRTPGGISRAELARSSGLASQTVSNAVSRLIEEGLVEDGDSYVHGRGKPRILVRLRPDARHAVGVNFDLESTAFIVLDLAGSVVARRLVRRLPITPPATLMRAIADGVDDIIGRAGVDRSRVLGIGLGTPGPIDSQLGRLLGHPMLPGWDNEPIRDTVAALTGLPVVMEKATNAAPAAHLWLHPEVRDFAFVYYAAGIGTGLVLNGQLHRGVSGNAGEGGTIVVPADGLPAARPSEYLGHLVAPRYLLEQAEAEGLHLTAGTEDGRFTELLDEYGRGSPVAVTVMERAGRILGRAMSTLVNLLDVGDLVFGGPRWTDVAAIFLPLIAEELANAPQRQYPHTVNLMSASVGDEVAAFGAACLVLESALTIDPAALLI